MPMKVGTHNGVFHADDVMAYCILKERFGDLEVVRTRNQELLGTCDLVFDVGMGKFDHHQKDKEYRENGVPYAACGLLWKEYGKDIISKYIQDEKEVNRIVQKIDEQMIQGIDALDNGHDVGKTTVSLHSISSIISQMNPSWDSTIDENKAFQNATFVADVVFNNAIENELSVYKANQVVIDSYNSRENPQILELKTFCPWMETLADIDVNKEVLYAIYPEKTTGYMVQVVRKELDGFEARADLPESWAGKRGADLAAETGLEDAVFCHPARFISGFQSLESAKTAAEIAIDIHMAKNGVYDMDNTIANFSLKESQSREEQIVDSMLSKVAVEYSKIKNNLNEEQAESLKYILSKARDLDLSVKAFDSNDFERGFKLYLEGFKSGGFTSILCTNRSDGGYEGQFEMSFSPEEGKIVSSYRDIRKLFGEFSDRAIEGESGYSQAGIVGFMDKEDVAKILMTAKTAELHKVNEGGMDK